MIRATKLMTMVVLVMFTFSLQAQSAAKKARAIKAYKQVLLQITNDANSLDKVLRTTKSPKAAAKAMDSFTNKWPAYQVKLEKLDKENPDIDGDEPPQELVDSISKFEASMGALAEALQLSGEKFGDDETFMSSIARLGETLGGSDDEEDSEVIEDGSEQLEEAIEQE